MKLKTGLCWLRRDLRLIDHTSLKNAGQDCDQVAVAFVFDKGILSKLKNKSDRRISFIFEALKEIDDHLKKQNSRLIVLFGDPIVEIPKLCKELDVKSVYTNEDYESYAKERDRKVRQSLEKMNISFHSYKDHVIFSGREVLKADETPYQVFTPYKNSWLKKLQKKDYSEAKVAVEKYLPAKKIANQNTLKPIEEYGFESAVLMLPTGRTGGLKLLRMFEKSLAKYDSERDFPALRGTSKVSAHLRFGTLSIREVLRYCKQHRGKGPSTWLSELVWRDFYFMILDQYPHVENQSFREKYKDIQWPGKEEHFKAWCNGQTGFPIVDAAMRQLNETGFMHNRLRMIVASFLVKDLLIDWRKGEAYFAEKLLDFDLAANNGGWQWSASTGCDAQPYFRIFNPDAQQKKFDSKEEFIEQWVPELKDDTGSYPDPIVNHKVQRQKALDLFGEK